MIEVDGRELRTELQWERVHRHVRKGQAGKGLKREWRSPVGNVSAVFYGREQTRPWSKRELEAERRERRARKAEAAASRRRLELAAARDEAARERELRSVGRCWGVDPATLGLDAHDCVVGHTAWQWVSRGLVPLPCARWERMEYVGGRGAWWYCRWWDVRPDAERAAELRATGPREFDRLPDGRPYDGRPWW